MKTLEGGRDENCVWSCVFVTKIMALVISCMHISLLFSLVEQYIKFNNIPCSFDATRYLCIVNPFQ